MPEFNEPVAPPSGDHTNPSAKCPFCPPESRRPFTTYPGASNQSQNLAKIMEQPSKLTSLQGGARPQTGAEGEQSGPAARAKPTGKTYTFQAHHLISGNQAMKGEPIEDWITSSDKNDKPTGYSINNTNNGFWAPSIPNQYVGKWSDRQGYLDDDERQSEAEKVMANFGAQIHIGPHDIEDECDPKGEKHTRYDEYLKEKLQLIHDRIHAWSLRCKCEPSAKPQATERVHNWLDNLSTHMIGELSGPRANWRVFISDYALEYHRPVCKHGEPARKKRRRG